VPWIVIDGRKGGSTLVVAAIHALLGLAEARQQADPAAADRQATRPASPASQRATATPVELALSSPGAGLVAAEPSARSEGGFTR
jgi:hypothetical protein